MYDWLSTWAQLATDRVAITQIDAPDSAGPRARVTFGQLDERSRRLAVALRDGFGVATGDRVAWLANNHIATFEAYFACMKLGAIFVPLNWRLAVPELRGILGDSEPRLLAYDDAWAGTAEALMSALDEPAGIALGEVRAGDHRAYDDVLAESSPGDAGIINGGVAVDVVSHLMYTSGTTGHPKGVQITNRQVLFNALNTSLACDLSASDSCLTFLPLFHTGGLHCLSTPILYRGGHVELMSTFDPALAARRLASGAVTTTIAVPTVYQMLWDAGLGEAPAGSIRQLLCGGAPLPIPLLETFHDASLPLRQGYGLTEVGPNCFSLAPLEGPHRKGSVGLPAFHSQARVVDDEGRAVPPDTPGELWLRGPHVTAGYWRNEAATRAVLDDDGWFHTGDMHRRTADGYHYVVGRKKEMFISGGENVYPAEVENVLSGHEWVHQVAVVGVPHPTWGQVGLAVIVPTEAAPTPPDADALRAFARERLAGYKVPKHWRFVAEMPLTSSGKIQKNVLAAEF